MVCAVATHRSLSLAQLCSPSTTFLGFADDVLDADGDPLTGHHARSSSSSTRSTRGSASSPA
eukprot:1686299-Prymnesium_polylepis.1